MDGDLARRAGNALNNLFLTRAQREELLAELERAATFRDLAPWAKSVIARAATLPAPEARYMSPGEMLSRLHSTTELCALYAA